MKKINKLLFISALTAVACLTSCSGGGSTTSQQSGSTSGLDPTQYVDISFDGVIDTDVDILLETFKQNGDPDTYYENRWLDLYREKCGVNVKWHWVAQGWDQKKQKLALDLVSGDLADVIAFDSIDMAQSAFDDGYTMDLTALFNNNASAKVKEQAESESSKIMMKSCTSDDGKLFAIPGFTNLLNQSPICYIRKDWLDNLGLSIPTSKSEIINVMKAFRDNDPDKNGKKDTYGIGLTGNFVQYQGEINGYAEMFGGYPYDWILGNDGKITYGGIEDGAKEGLRWLQQMYNGDYIDKEFVTKDCNNLVDDISNGKVGLVYAPYWMIENALHNGWTRNKNMEWCYIPIYDDEGIATVNADSFARQYIAIKKDFAHPEKVMEMINLYYEMYLGSQENFAKYIMDDKYPNIWHLSPLQFVDSREYGCTNYYREVLDIISDPTKYDDAHYISKMVYDIHKKVEEGKTYANGGLTLSEWKRYNYYGPNSSAAALAKYEDAKTYKVSYVYDPTINVRTTIGSVQIDNYMKIITKNANVDTTYATFINDWKSRGGTKLINNYNEWYTKRF